MKRRTIFFTIIACAFTAFISACSNNKDVIIALDDRIYDYVAKDSKLEILGKGYGWSEGPVWIEDRNYLLFTDVPGNVIYKWDQENGAQKFFSPSGLAKNEIEDFQNWQGANGLIIGEEYNHIYMAVHSQRAIIAMDLQSKGQTILSNSYEDKKFSSPNDLILARNGSLFFTDPPYGLKSGNASPGKEIDANGVYRTDPDGSTYLLISDLSLPNGVALSPDQKTLYVTNSDPNNRALMAYDLDNEGNISNGRLFQDFSYAKDNDLSGNPDGLAVNADGTLFVAGPGGISIIDKTGTLLGMINTGLPTANCTLGNKGKMLYITAQSKLLRIALK